MNRRTFIGLLAAAAAAPLLPAMPAPRVRQPKLLACFSNRGGAEDVVVFGDGRIRVIHDEYVFDLTECGYPSEDIVHVPYERLGTSPVNANMDCFPVVEEWGYKVYYDPDKVLTRPKMTVIDVETCDPNAWGLK